MKIFSVVKYTLYPFTLIYGGIVWMRNRLYDSGIYGSVSFDFPVINVGNLSTGGTGKTPHVEYLIRLLQYRNVVATMSRGYKRHTQGFLLAGPDANALKIGDEPMQYLMKYPDTVVSVAEDRMTGVPSLLQRRPDVDVLLLDDAYQHRSVKAGLNILITDYSKPFYNDYILPLGRLRESRSASARADIIIVSKCPLTLTKEEAESIKQKINPLAHQQVFFSGIQYGMPYDFISKQHLPYAHKNVIMVCGIANPAPMMAELEKHANAVHALTYSDHHYFVSKDIQEMNNAYRNWAVDNKVIVTTEKDAARLLLLKDQLQEMNLPIAVLPMEIVFLQNEGADFDKAIDDFVAAYRQNLLEDLPAVDFEEL